MSVEIIGVSDLVDKLDRIAAGEKIKQNINDACLMVERTAKENCPVRTGELRSSIASNVDDFTGEVGTPLQYAVYVEYGTGLFAANGGGRTDVPWKYQDAKGEWHSTSGMPPQPFLVPALNQNREAIIDKFKEGILDD